ncbi:DNA-cytosine methyltransferase [[Leptolyngbya] sp. PCC 7376]|uniref:DNA cytosine methyltransferase n=1 Tax=[Leptolyngbya] sp. PCC 7376 TaxID=111781 RepID=UPI00029EC581|nr:DNA cytosine methyltransferase [[Leptolyngbya] sp. PCC 7376]AFY37844.1 DNA-cytosine methyltransferase [[Leptolyngbya] sp. PCC 7376]
MPSQQPLKPAVLDVFCGAGGMSLGFQRAGCKILGGIDHNPHAVTTHHQNFPKCKLKLEATDIRTLEDLPSLNLQPREVDILIGGPPCQVFSRVGLGKMKHDLKWDIEKDHRNFLYKEYVRFVDYYQPFFFVMENVDNLANKKELLSTILDELAACGYKVEYEVLDSSKFGVPQRRRRIFLIGVRSDLLWEPIFPKPSGQKAFSVGDAISDLPELKPIILSLKSKSRGPRQKDCDLLYRGEPESIYQQKMRRHNGDRVRNHLCRAHNDKDLEIFKTLKQGGKYRDLPEEMMRYRVDIFDDKYHRLYWDKPSWTLTAHMRKDCLAYIHPLQTRSISVREAARIQSFPDNFVFQAPMTRMFELIGNSVPPLLAEAVAKPIVKLIRRYYSQKVTRQNDTVRSKVS